MSDKRDLEQRLAFLDLHEEDLRLLGELGPVLERHADLFVASFYRQLLSYERTRELLSDPEVKERLLRKQREYLLSLAGPCVDASYVAERKRIGVTHERIGLEPRWYLGAYSIYFSLLAPVVCESFAGDTTRGERALTALMKLLMFDAQIAMEAYIERRERQLAYLNRELASAGRSLARDYEEQSLTLRQTSERARIAEDLASVATLAAGLAHEIGTPMGVIQGHAELLESSVADERGRWRLGTIREQIERISRIIQALLNFARPQPTLHQPVELQPVLETALSFLGEKFRQRTIRVETRFEPSPSVLGDAEKLQQLFLNLFLNAADAMPEGGRLGVTLGPDDDEPDTLLVRVSDTGVGIPEDRLERIFDAFYTSKPSGQGSGLGLLVARRIVVELNGRVEVTSKVGVGTEFRVRFPAARPQSGVSEGS